MPAAARTPTAVTHAGAARWSVHPLLADDGKTVIGGFCRWTGGTAGRARLAERWRQRGPTCATSSKPLPTGSGRPITSFATLIFPSAIRKRPACRRKAASANVAATSGSAASMTATGTPISTISRRADRSATSSSPISMPASDGGSPRSAVDRCSTTPARSSATAASAATSPARSKREQQIRFLAQHDALTGLPNRSLFKDRLRQVVAQAKRTESGFAVLCVDLDDFKQVNDTLGHVAGDAVLCEMARRMQVGRPRDRHRRSPRRRRVHRHPDRRARMGRRQGAGRPAARRRCREPIDLGGEHGRMRRQHRDQPLPRRRRGPGRSDPQRRSGPLQGEGNRTGAPTASSCRR